MTDENRQIHMALEKDFSDERFKPTDLHLDKRDGLKIKWADGHASHYPLPYLRSHCPCASCREERQKPAEINTGRSLTILPSNISRAAEFVNAQLVGHYAMQIEWGDGHSTGIYDFRYLRSICPSDDQDSLDS